MVTGALAMGKGNMMPSYSDFDTDGNGKITKKEFQKTQQKRMTQRAEDGRMMRNAGDAPAFSDIDKNNDGIIDKGELQKHQGTGQGRNR